MTDENVKMLVEKLDRIVKLLAFSVIHGKTQREQITVLSNAGFGPKEISAFLNTTPGTVRVELTALRKQGLVPKVQKAKK